MSDSVKPSWRPSKQTAPSWAAGAVAIIAALGGGAGVRELLKQGDQQTAALARIEARLESLKEDLTKLEHRQSITETWVRQHHTRAEVYFAVSSKALRNEGYDVRGVQDDQVDFASVKNRKRPVRPVSPDGRELEIPVAVPPPPVR